MPEESNYYAWIPTNTGKLSFDLIIGNPLLEDVDKIIKKESIEIQKFDLAVFSDTYNNDREKSLKLYYEKNDKEVFAKANIKIAVDQTLFIGAIELFIDSDVIYTCKFKLEQTGKLLISNLKLYIHDIEIDDIAQYLFILIKSIVHGDSHHHQKIDTISFVMKDEFDCLKVIDNFKDYTKNIQISFRNFSEDEKCLKLLRIETIENEIGGYLSYLKVFKKLFCINAETKKLASKEIKIIKHVEESIVANANTLKEKKEFLHVTVMYILAILGVIFSKSFKYK